MSERTITSCRHPAQCTSTSQPHFNMQINNSEDDPTANELKTKHQKGMVTLVVGVNVLCC